MNEQDRVSRFEQDITQLRLKTSGGSVEHLAGIVGVVMMAAGIGIAVGAAFKTGTKQDERDIQELIVLNLAMLGLVISGAALFLWRVLSQFGRYWMLRQTFEHQRHIDQVLEATKPASSPTPTTEGRVMELVSETEARGRPVGYGGTAPGTSGA